MCGDALAKKKGHTFYCDGMHHDGDKTVRLSTNLYDCGNSECDWGICEACYWQDVQALVKKDPAEAANHMDIIEKMAFRTLP